MIKSISIKNYRSIKYAYINLGGITVIVGPSDSGKSNIIRAIRDWAFNAIGTDFINKGSHTVYVEVILIDNKGRDFNILWKKGKTDPPSTYVVEYPNKNLDYKDEFRLGRNVPTEVKNLTKIDKFDVTSKFYFKPNFHFQSEPWFLLSNPPWKSSLVSKLVASLSGLDCIYKAIYETNLNIKRNKREGTILSKRIGEIQERIDVLPDVKEVGKQIDEIVSLYDEIIDLDNLIKNSGKLYKKLLNKKSELKIKKNRINKLVEIIDSININELDNLYQRLKNVRKEFGCLKGHLDKYEVVSEKVKKDKNKVESINDKILDIISDGNICPLCESEISDKNKERILENA